MHRKYKTFFQKKTETREKRGTFKNIHICAYIFKKKKITIQMKLINKKMHLTVKIKPYFKPFYLSFSKGNIFNSSISFFSEYRKINKKFKL